MLGCCGLYLDLDGHCMATVKNVLHMLCTQIYPMFVALDFGPTSEVNRFMKTPDTPGARPGHSRGTGWPTSATDQQGLPASDRKPSGAEVDAPRVGCATGEAKEQVMVSGVKCRPPEKMGSLKITHKKRFLESS